MKAALEACGSNNNLFHQGAAGKRMIPRSSRRPWLNRAAFSAVVGSSGPFTEHAALPTDLAGENVSETEKAR